MKTMRDTATSSMAARLRPHRQTLSRRVLGWLVLLLSFLVINVRTAAAHARTATFSTIAITEEAVTWRVRVAAADLLAPVGLPELVPSGAQAVARLTSHLGRAEDYVRQRLHVFRGDRPCTHTMAQCRVSEDDDGSIELRVTFVCSTTGAHRMRYDLFFDLDPLHTGYVQLVRGDINLGADIFRRDSRDVTVVLAPSPWAEVKRFWLLGVEHIFTGYDHLAFLAGLLVMVALVRTHNAWQGAPPRVAFISAAKLVTSFTVAHSLTLALAALRPGAVRTAWVEPAIALSVALVGAENLLPRVPRRRWMLVFAFGLVHGFGFASVLQEVGLPDDSLLRALIAFNLGVESGQLALVAVTLPALIWLSRARPRFYVWAVLRGASVALVAAGLAWFVARV